MTEQRASTRDQAGHVERKKMGFLCLNQVGIKEGQDDSESVAFASWNKRGDVRKERKNIRKGNPPETYHAGKEKRKKRLMT